MLIIQLNKYLESQHFIHDAFSIYSTGINGYLYVLNGESLVVTNDRINLNPNYNLSICIDAQEWIVTFYFNAKTMESCCK